MATMCGMILGVGDSDGVERLRRLAAERRKLDAEMDALTEQLLRRGEFVAAIADAQGVSREKIRRFRDDHDIPDTREIRRAKGAPTRRDKWRTLGSACLMKSATIPYGEGAVDFVVKYDRRGAD
jgi:hypothetical protein